MTVRTLQFTAPSICLSLACADTREVRGDPATSNFLSDCSKLKPEEGEGARLVYLKPGLSLTQYRAVHVEPVMLVASAKDSALTVGKARAEIEVKDGGTGEQLGAGVDERVGTRGVSGVTNKWSDVQMAFDAWAESFRKRLAELRAR